MATISGCRHHKGNLKAKIYIYVNSTTQRCPNKIIKNFLIEGFFHLPPVSLTPVANLELRISPRIFEKIRNRPKWYNQRLGGYWFKKKTRGKKSRDTVPLNTDDDFCNILMLQNYQVFSWYCLLIIVHRFSHFAFDFMAPYFNNN